MVSKIRNRGADAAKCILLGMLISWQASARGSDTDCESANKSATDIYEAMRKAHVEREYLQLSRLNEDFWDIYRRNRECDRVIALGMTLTAAGAVSEPDERAPGSVRSTYMEMPDYLSARIAERLRSDGIGVVEKEQFARSRSATVTPPTGGNPSMTSKIGVGSVATGAQSAPQGNR